MCAAGETAEQQSSWRVEGRRLPVNFALGGYTGWRAEWLLFLDGSSAGVRDELDALLPGRCSGSGHISVHRD
jgi:hypothetical protein